jgi:dolichol-phosphate mannosyltransferase
MDADGQHDMSVLPKLFAAVQAGNDMAIGSRYVAGGSVGQWDERRYALSRLGTKLAVRLCAVAVHDPMSGFFAVRRETFEAALPRLNPKGFKILLDVLVHVPAVTRVTEVPFTFSQRLHGESKLSWRVQLDFVEYLYDVVFGRFIPLTFVKYCAVGLMGALVNLAAYALAAWFLTGTQTLSTTGFSISVLLAIEAAILFNFTLNNAWTFQRQRLRGAAAVAGFFKYNLACALGALANYSVSLYFFAAGTHPLLSVMTGALVGAAWNYTMSRMLTWRLG